MAKPLRLLIIGYGNAYRRDDGVAFYVINRLRAGWGIPALREDEDGQDGLNGSTDTIMLHQLIPEIVPVATQYNLIIFVDAHTGTIPEQVRVIEIKEEFGLHAVTHHISPGMVLAMAKQAGGPVPRAYLVSIRGEDFDFGLGLSSACETRAKEAVQKILNLIKELH